MQILGQIAGFVDSVSIGPRGAEARVLGRLSGRPNPYPVVPGIHAKSRHRVAQRLLAEGHGGVAAIPFKAACTGLDAEFPEEVFVMWSLIAGAQRDLREQRQNTAPPPPPKPAPKPRGVSPKPESTGRKIAREAVREAGAYSASEFGRAVCGEPCARASEALYRALTRD